jgi:hypothetical protein
MDLEDWRLYWVNAETSSVQYYELEFGKVVTVPLESHPTAAVVYNGFLYYASQDDAAIHVADKTNGEKDRVLRNNTG